jgi:hypothetical protein
MTEGILVIGFIALLEYIANSVPLSLCALGHLKPRELYGSSVHVKCDSCNKDELAEDSHVCSRVRTTSGGEGSTGSTKAR